MLPQWIRGNHEIIDTHFAECFELKREHLLVILQGLQVNSTFLEKKKKENAHEDWVGRHEKISLVTTSLSTPSVLRCSLVNFKFPVARPQYSSKRSRSIENGRWFLDVTSLAAGDQNQAPRDLSVVVLGNYVDSLLSTHVLTNRATC